MKKKSLVIILFLIIISSLAACAKLVVLDTPTNLSINNTTLSWSSVEGAENGYTVNVNNREVAIEKGVISLDFLAGTSKASEYIVYGKNEFTVKANAVSDMILESAYSEVIVYTKPLPVVPPDKTQLLQPSNIGIDKSVEKLVWDKVSGASGYKLYFSGVLGEKDSTTNEFKFTNLASGNYDVSIVAIGMGNFINSEKSLVFSFKKLEMPQVTFNAQKGELKWNSPLGATKYLVIDGSKEVETTGTIYTAEFSGNDISKRFIKVIAKGDSNTFDSVETSDFAVSKLATPTGFSFDDSTKTFSWNPVQNASGYKLSIAQQDYFATGTSLPVMALPNETFTARLVAMHEDYVSSSLLEITVTVAPIPQLNKVDSISIDKPNTRITWNSVQNATKYSVQINSDVEQITTDTYYSLANKPSGNYTVTICALADNFAASEGTVKQFRVLASPTLTFDYINKKVTWTAVDGSVGYVVKDGAELPQISTLEYLITFVAGNNDIQSRQILVKSIAGADDFSSAFESVTVKKLAKVTNLSYNDNTKMLNFIASAESEVTYKVLLNGVLHDTININYISLSSLNYGTYNIEVYAIKNGFIDGDKSDSISVTVKNALDNVTGFAYDDLNKQLKWNAVNSADNGYSIIVNDDIANAINVSGVTYSISGYGAGVYSFTVLANAANNNSASEISQAINVTIVEDIKLGLSKDTGDLTVSSTYSSEITVTVNGNPTSLTNGKISLSEYAAGAHTFVFEAKANGNYIGDTKTQVVNIIQTATVTNARVSINKLVFDKLANHTYGIKYGNIANDLENNYVALPSGTYVVTLSAKEVNDNEFTYVKASAWTQEITIKEGSATSKYEVSTETDFKNMIAADGKHFVQTANIEFTEKFTHAIFNGDYDGGGFSLGVQINPLDFVNIFGLNQGKIANLKIYIDATDNLIGDETGGLVGINTGFIENVEVYGSITSTSSPCLGGIAGKSERDIIGSVNRADIIGSSVVGGISGVVERKTGSVVGGYVNDCKNYGAITANGDTVGGIIGFAQKGYIISSCINYGNVTAVNNVGGIIGSNAESKDGSDGIKIEKCGNEGNITASGNNAGGISGYQRWADILVSYNKGNVTANEHAGGIVGSANKTEVKYCYNVGEISVMTNNVGGIAGSQFNWGVNPDGNKSKVGGSYNIGNIIVNGATNKGYICGVNNDTYSSYYLDTLSEGLNSDGWQVLAKSESDMKLQNFVDDLNTIINNNAVDAAYLDSFVLDTSNINNGYPIFAYQII